MILATQELDELMSVVKKYLKILAIQGLDKLMSIIKKISTNLISKNYFLIYLSLLRTVHFIWVDLHHASVTLNKRLVIFFPFVIVIAVPI